MINYIVYVISLLFCKGSWSARARFGGILSIREASRRIINLIIERLSSGYNLRILFGNNTNINLHALFTLRSDHGTRP